jgi:hypothetical protein
MALSHFRMCLLCHATFSNAPSYLHIFCILTFSCPLLHTPFLTLEYDAFSCSLFKCSFSLTQSLSCILIFSCPLLHTHFLTLSFYQASSFSCCHFLMCTFFLLSLSQFRIHTLSQAPSFLHSHFSSYHFFHSLLRTLSLSHAVTFSLALFTLPFSFLPFSELKLSHTRTLSRSIKRQRRTD